jgi:hypothetical protein
MASSPKRKRRSERPSSEQDFDVLLQRKLEREQDAFNSSGEFAQTQGMVTKSEWLMKHGRFFAPRRLPAGYRHGTLKECYSNSSQLAIKRGLTYCEGLLLSSAGNLLPHAWCLDGDQRLLEVTLKEPGRSYFGVAFSTSFLQSHEQPLIDEVVFATSPADDWKWKKQ